MERADGVVRHRQVRQRLIQDLLQGRLETGQAQRQDAQSLSQVACRTLQLIPGQVFRSIIKAREGPWASVGHKTHLILSLVGAHVVKKYFEEK